MSLIAPKKQRRRSSRASVDLLSIGYQPTYDDYPELSATAQHISINQDFEISIEIVNYDYYDYENAILNPNTPEEPNVVAEQEKSLPLKPFYVDSGINSQDDLPQRRPSYASFDDEYSKSQFNTNSAQLSPFPGSAPQYDVNDNGLSAEDEVFKTIFYETRKLNLSGFNADDTIKIDLPSYKTLHKIEFAEEDRDLILFSSSSDDEQEEEIVVPKVDFSKTTHEKFSFVSVTDPLKANENIKICPEIKIKESRASELEMDIIISRNDQLKWDLKMPFLDTRILKKISTKFNPLYDRIATELFSSKQATPLFLRPYYQSNKCFEFNKTIPDKGEFTSKVPQFINLYNTYDISPTVESSKFNPSNSVMLNSFCFEKDLIESLPEASEYSGPKFGLLSLIKFDVDCVLFEPIICSAFLYSNGKICTERWNFAHQTSIDFLQDNEIFINHFKNIAFELGEGEMYLVIEIRRPLLIGAGAEVNEYYLKPDDLKIRYKAQECVAKTWPRSKNIFTTFAVVCTPLARILDTPGEFWLTDPIIINQPATQELIGKIISFDSSVEQFEKLNWKFCFKGTRYDSKSIVEIEDKGYYTVLQCLPPVLSPTCFYINKVFFGIKKISIKAPRGVKIRNLFAKIYAYADKENIPVKLIRSPLTGKRELFVITQCWYHNEKPRFNEIFSVDFPFPASQTFYFHVEFFHGIAQESTNDAQFIGYTDIRVFDENGHFNIQNQQAPIIFKDATDFKDSHVTYTMRMRSTFYSEDPNLQDFFLHAHESCSVCPQCIEQAKPVYIKIHLLSLISFLSASLTKQPWRSMKCLYTINRYLGPTMGIELDKFAHTFAMNYSLQTLSEKTTVHLSIFSAWTQMIIQNRERNEDGHFLGYLFCMILKSMMVSTNDTYVQAADEWSACFFKQVFNYVDDENSFRLRMTKVSWFIQGLFELGKFTAANKLINNLIKFNFMKNKDFTGLQILFRYILSPRVFYVLSTRFPAFRDLYQYTYNRVYASMINERFSDIAYTLFHISMCLPQEFRQSLSNSYNTMKGYKSPLQGFFYSPLNADQISETDFDSYWKGLDHRSFFKVFHFFVTNYQYKFDYIPQDPEMVAHAEIVHAMQRGFFAQLLSLNRVETIADIEEVCLGYYHVFTSNLCVDNIPLACKTFKDFIVSHPYLTMKFSTPYFPSFLRIILNFSKAAPDSATEVFDAMFDANYGTEVFGMALAAVAVTVATTKPAVLERALINPKSPLARNIPRIIKIYEQPVGENVTKYIKSHVLVYFDAEQKEEIISAYDSFYEELMTKSKDPLPKFR